MLSLRVAELRARRYAGFDGTPGARTLPEVLTAHVVPATPQALDEARFYADLEAPAAREAVRATLVRMRAASPQGGVKGHLHD